MTQKTTISPLLESIVQDNFTFKFPIECISKEIVQLFLAQEEFDYFMMQSFRKLKKEYGETIAHIFLTTLETKINLRDNDIHTLSIQQYQTLMEDFLTTLERLYITRIEKDSPDGELMSAMI